MTLTNNTLSNIIIIYTTITIITTWLAIITWTSKDIKTRTQDKITQSISIAITATLPIPGIILYLLLRPKETLNEAYERSLEEEALLQEIEKKPNCPGCSQQTETTWQICAHCHTQLKRPCTHCQNLLNTSWTICPYCTAPQPNETITQQPARIEFTNEPNTSYTT